MYFSTRFPSFWCSLTDTWLDKKHDHCWIQGKKNKQAIMVPLGVRHRAIASIHPGLKAQLFHLDFIPPHRKYQCKLGGTPGAFVRAYSSPAVAELDTTPPTSVPALGWADQVGSEGREHLPEGAFVQLAPVKRRAKRRSSSRRGRRRKRRGCWWWCSNSGELCVHAVVETSDWPHHGVKARDRRELGFYWLWWWTSRISWDGADYR